MSKNIYTTSDFDFNLPSSLIANSPSVPRDHSRLLVYNSKNDNIIHTHFYDILNYLDENDVIVRNKSKVIPARLLFDINGNRKEVYVAK